MIDYATLCRAIDDWKNGRRPVTAPMPAVPRDPNWGAALGTADGEQAADYEVELDEAQLDEDQLDEGELDEAQLDEERPDEGELGSDDAAERPSWEGKYV